MNTKTLTSALLLVSVLACDEKQRPPAAATPTPVAGALAKADMLDFTSSPPRY